MIAVDTNVLIRYVTNDDPAQARKAANLLGGTETIFIAHSVLLEMEWILRAIYELPRPAILNAIRQVLGLPSTRVDQAVLIAETLERYERGFDFADALHLALTSTASRLVTFDKRFVRAAEAVGLAAVSEGDHRPANRSHGSEPPIIRTPLELTEAIFGVRSCTSAHRASLHTSAHPWRR